MEFWGIEVKPGQIVKCEPGEEKLLHLSQAAIGETKKAAENVVLYVKFNDQKLVIGTLSGEKCPQTSYDLVFEKEFELSHSSKNASVHFTGYKSLVPDDDDIPSDFDDFDSEEKDVEVAPTTVNREAKVNGALMKVAEKDMKSKAKAGKPILSERNDDDEDSSGDEDYSDDDDSGESDDDEDMVEAGSDDEEDSDAEDEEESDAEDDDSEDQDEETPEKSANGKKRPAQAVTKAAAAEKKAKIAAPADGKKTDAKKDTPAKSDKGKQQTPKSGGSFACKSCSKSFNSEKSLESHSKAKHSAVK